MSHSIEDEADSVHNKMCPVMRESAVISTNTIERKKSTFSDQWTFSRFIRFLVPEKPTNSSSTKQISHMIGIYSVSNTVDIHCLLSQSGSTQ